MGVILAIALDAASDCEALASAGPSTLSLLAAAVAVMGLWLWGRQRRSLLRPPAFAWAAGLPPQRSPDILPPARSAGRVRTPDPAASSSLLRAPPGASASVLLILPPDPRCNLRRRPFDPARTQRPG
jgi:hypothetical protein